MANINQIRLSGTTYQIEDSSANKTVSLTQAQYDALAVKDPNTYYVITDASGSTITVDSAISSSSTNPVQNAVIYQQFGGLKLQQITQSDYDALSTKDASTLYVIVN